ncbi:MAG: hypothetical protein WAT20_04425 [Ferruginibacter sp.]
MISQHLNKPEIKKAFIYIILWAAGSIVACSILFFWNTAGNFESITIFNNLDKRSVDKKTYNDIVDELLLSANELKIYGKSSIIEYNYKDNSITDESLIQQIKADPGKAYNTILKNKLDNLNKRKSPVSDFNVKPVPK